MWLLLVLCLFAAFLFHQLYWRRRLLPPGPTPWPLFGNIFAIDPKRLEEQFLDFKFEYGKVFTLWLPTPAIIISDSQLFKDTIVKHGDAFAGRPPTTSLQEIQDGCYGLILNKNDYWRSQRRFALHVLRDFGIGKPVLEDAIISQAASLCDVLKAVQDTPVDPTDVFAFAVGNIICRLTFGLTLTREDETFVTLRHSITEVGKLVASPVSFLMEFWTGFKYLDPLFGNQYHNAKTANNKLFAFVTDQIEQHRRTLDFDSEPRDYIDAFLIEQRKHKNADGSLPDEWSDAQLKASIADLFAAGMETTSTTLRYLLLHLVRKPQIQHRIHAEIDREIGRDRQITMRDQTRLPYLNACLQELQRIAILLTLNLPRLVMEDTEVAGYRIPRGLTVVPQFQSVHLDEHQFPDPQIFVPARHLDAEGKFCKDDRITPFSIGKRSCLGESLARMELFLFSATMLQHFEFGPEVEGVMPEVTFNIGVLKAPQGFKVTPRPRK